MRANLPPGRRFSPVLGFLQGRQAGWPRAVARPGLPQIRTCGFPASGSSVRGPRSPSAHVLCTSAPRCGYPMALRVPSQGLRVPTGCSTIGATDRLPLPSTGSRREQFPGVIGTTRSSDFSPPFPLHFVLLRSAVPPHRPAFARAPPGRPRRALGGLGQPGLPFTGLPWVEAARYPRFLVDPLAFVPCSSTPRGPARSGLLSTAPMLPSAPTTASAPPTTLISGLNRTARPLAVYASQPGSPRIRARLASGCWPALPGWDFHPPGPATRFQGGPLGIPSSSSRLRLAQGWFNPAMDLTNPFRHAG